MDESLREEIRAYLLEFASWKVERERLRARTDEDGWELYDDHLFNPDSLALLVQGGDLLEKAWLGGF